MPLWRKPGMTGWDEEAEKDAEVQLAECQRKWGSNARRRNSHSHVTLGNKIEVGYRKRGKKTMVLRSRRANWSKFSDFSGTKGLR